MRYLKIKNFLQKVSTITLRKKLKIHFFKYDVIKHIKMNARNILMLYFVFVMIAQHVFYNFLHRQKYYYCRIKYAQNFCALFFDKNNVNVNAQNRDLVQF